MDTLEPAFSRSLEIAGRPIHDDSDPYVIAEIGQNHMGRVDVCRELFLAAKQCGCDAVKIQKRSNKSLYTKAMYSQPYDNENSFGETYGAHREALEFGWAEYVDLMQYAEELDIHMFATAWDFESIEFLARLDVPAFKVASADLVAIPHLVEMAKIGKPMIISTGGATMDDIQRAMDAVLPLNTKVALLQCTAAYPVEPEDMNLRVISTLREAFPTVVVGLSDHQNGIAMSILAYALGARVFEKHFTKNRSWKGGDQAFSLEPDGMRRMVRDLKRARVALGSPEKKPYPMEVKPLTKMRKSIVAASDLPAGTVLKPEHLAYKSPGGAMEPYRNGELLGRTLRHSVVEDHAFSLDDLA